MRDNEIAKGSENVSQNLDAQPNFNHQELQQAAANNMVSERASQGNAVDNNGQIDFSKHQLKGFDNSTGSQAGNSNAEATGMQPANGSSSENPQQPGRTGTGDAATSGTSGNDSVDGRSGSGEIQVRKNGSADGATNAESGEGPHQKNPADGSAKAESSDSPKQKNSADGSAKAGSEDAVKQSGGSATSGSNEAFELGSAGKSSAATNMEATGASPQPKAIESEGGAGKNHAMKEAEGNAVKTQESTQNSPVSAGAAAVPLGVSGAANATAGSGRPGW